ncbi:MAG: pyridoxal phosphate-dependent aminotransferase [Ktedonobacterales bacterium]
MQPYSKQPIQSLLSLNPSLADQAPNPLFRIAALVHGRGDVVHLEFGEPDAPTPAHIVEAAMASLREERQGYGPTMGIPSLRQALAERVARVNRIETTAERIILSAGGTGALTASLLAICSPGCDVLIPDPAWAGYDAILATAGARAVRYPLLPEVGWQPDLDALDAAITPQTRVLLINSPSNPGGAVFPRETVERLVEFARRHELWLLSDECYDEFVYEGEHVSPATLDLDGRVLTIGTFSKSYAMTGWRIGWVVAPQAAVGPITLAVTAQLNNLPLFVQRAAEAALAGSQECVRAMARTYRERRDLAVEILRAHGLLEYVPAGAFYLLARVAGRDGAAPFDGVAFAEALVRERGIAVAPGGAFGSRTADYVRVSLASATEALRAGLEGALEFAGEYGSRG